jgi:hypothetical protein
VSGTYETWSDFLPGGADDIIPGDAVDVKVPSRRADFRAIVQKVELELVDVQGEHSRYKIDFTDDSSESMSFELDGASTAAWDKPAVDVSKVGSTVIADVVGAAVTDVTSTSVSVNTGVQPPAGGGIEVRRTDYGWGPDNDRNLIGRFATSVFTLIRLGRVQDYYLRQYDASNPPKYSRNTTALHVDYPL